MRKKVVEADEADGDVILFSNAFGVGVLGPGVGEFMYPLQGILFGGRRQPRVALR